MEADIRMLERDPKQFWEDLRNDVSFRVPTVPEKERSELAVFALKNLPGRNQKGDYDAARALLMMACRGWLDMNGEDFRNHVVTACRARDTHRLSVYALMPGLPADLEARILFTADAAVQEHGDWRFDDWQTEQQAPGALVMLSNAAEQCRQNRHGRGLEENTVIETIIIADTPHPIDEEDFSLLLLSEIGHLGASQKQEDLEHLKKEWTTIWEYTNPLTSGICLLWLETTPGEALDEVAMFLVTSGAKDGAEALRLWARQATGARIMLLRDDTLMEALASKSPHVRQAALEISLARRDQGKAGRHPNTSSHKQIR